MYIFCVTWLTRSVYKNEILPANITIYLRDRCTRGGGVLIAVSNAISSRLVHSSDTVELIAVELGLVPKVLLCCLYIPPASSDQYLLHVLDSIDSLCTDNDIILTGDFNAPDINWLNLSASSSFSSSLCDSLYA